MTGLPAGFLFSLMSYGVAQAAVSRRTTTKLISLSVSGPHLQFIITAATLKIQGEPTMTLSNMPVYAMITDRNRGCCCCNEYSQRSFMQWLIAIYM